MRRIIFAFASTAILQFFNIATGIMIARFLGPAHRGELSQIVAWFGFVSSVSIFGISDAVIYYKSPKAGLSVFSAALFALIPASLLGMSACALIVLFHFSLFPQSARTASWIYILVVPLFQLQFVVTSYLQAGNNIRAWSIVRIMPAPVYAAGIIVASFFGHASVVGIATASLFSLLTMAVIGLYFVTKEEGLPPKPSPALSTELVKYGFPLTLQRVSVSAKDNLDKMVLPFFVTSTALGNYVVAATFAFLIYLVGFTVDLVAFPAIVRASDTAAKANLAERAISSVFLSVAAAIVLLLPFSEALVRPIFGPEYISAAPLVPYFLVAGGLQAVRIVMAGTLKAFGRNHSVALIEGAALLVLAATLVAAGPALGPYAGVTAHLISASIAIVLTGGVAFRALGLSPSGMLLASKADILQLIYTMRSLLRAG